MGFYPSLPVDAEGSLCQLVEFLSLNLMQMVKKFFVKKGFFNHLHQINAQKLGQLIGPQIISDSSPENFKTVVTIPENLLLSNSEKSVLDKGLNFVPIS